MDLQLKKTQESTANLYQILICNCLERVIQRRELLLRAASPDPTLLCPSKGYQKKKRKLELFIYSNTKLAILIARGGDFAKSFKARSI